MAYMCDGIMHNVKNAKIIKILNRRTGEESSEKMKQSESETYSLNLKLFTTIALVSLSAAVENVKCEIVFVFADTLNIMPGVCMRERGRTMYRHRGKKNRAKFKWRKIFEN